MAVGVVVVLATFVLPKFKTFFASLGAKLPLPTRMLLSISAFVEQWWWAIAVIVRGARSSSTMVMRRTECGKARSRRVCSRSFPVVGSLVQAADRRADLPRSRLAGHCRRRPSPRHGRDGRIIEQCGLHGRSQSSARADDGGQRSLRAARRDRACFLPRRVRCSGLAKRRERWTSNWRLRPPFTTGSSKSRSSISPVCSSRRSSSSWASIVGFVAVALVTAMYGIYKQVNIGGVIHLLHLFVSECHRVRL